MKFNKATCNKRGPLDENPTPTPSCQSAQAQRSRGSRPVPTCAGRVRSGGMEAACASRGRGPTSLGAHGCTAGARAPRAGGAPGLGLQLLSRGLFLREDMEAGAEAGDSAGRAAPRPWPRVPGRVATRPARWELENLREGPQFRLKPWTP